MAYMLFKYIRRKVRENKARKEAFSTADESHLTPNVSHTAPARESHELLTSTGAHPTPPTNPISTENTIEHERLREEAKRMRIHRWKMIFGLILPNFLASVDVTIVAPAIPTISSHFSAAGVMNLTRIVLSDGMSLADNSKNNTIFGLINVGPVIGGYLTKASWRYTFVVPIPIAVLSHVLIFVLMRKDLVKGRVNLNSDDSRRTGYITGLGHIDWIGMITFILGIGLLILAVQWGGTSYAWSSAATIAPFIIGGILMLIFFIHEYLLGPGRFMSRIFTRQVAMIPSTLFRKKDTSLLMIINFSAGVSLVSAFYFVSYYWQLAEGYNSSKAGTQLLYYTPGLGIGVYSAMFMCNYWPKQTFYPLFVGSIVEAVGLSAMTWAISARNTTLVSVFLAVAGAGTGFRFMPVVLHAAGIWPSRIAAMQSVLSFTLPLGETIGISMMGAVFSNKFTQYLSAIASGNGSSFTSSTDVSNLDSLASLPPAVQEDVRNAAARAVMWAFISVLPFMALSIAASAFVSNVWIGNPKKVSEDGTVKREEKKGMVMTSPFLLAVFTGGISRNRMEVDPATEQELGEKHGEWEREAGVESRAVQSGEA
ncbi:hypothetical protein N0V90_003971 [Kalmusia sp. IMI 367209]|nr:hypothetical protein N0V90_003971 [Kalmusia sp. IMI 367209]